MIARSDERLVVACVDGSVDAGAGTPQDLIERFHGSRGWAEAVADAGASVAVVQRYAKDAFVRRGPVGFHFVADRSRRAVSMPAAGATTFFGARLVRAVRRLAPDVVHVDGLVFPALVLALRASLSSHTTIVVQDHGGLYASSTLFRDGSRARRLWFAAGLRCADGALFTAREQAVPWQRAGILGEGQPVYEVPESSTELGPTAPRPGSGEALPGRPALLWVGRLNANKDPRTVLDGFDAAAHALPEAALTLVYGEDDLIDEVRARIARSAFLRQRVHLRGRVDRSTLASLYAGADAFVLASHHEGSGYALLEALSFGVTPVVTDIPPFRALTDGGKIGALFPVGDSLALAAALRGLSREAPDARRAAVRAFFDRALAWPAVGRRALDIYQAAALRRVCRVSRG